MLTLWPGPAATVLVASFEPAELGSQTGDALPLGIPLQGGFLVVGSEEDTSEVSVPARTADGLLACLFTTRLAGASHLKEGSTYRMVAVFESSRSTPTGRLLTAEPATIAIAGPEVELPSRFAEQREALSTWLSVNGLRGTLRSDGVPSGTCPNKPPVTLPPSPTSAPTALPGSRRSAAEALQPAAVKTTELSTPCSFGQ